MKNSTGLDFKRYKRVYREVSLQPFFLQCTVPFSEAFQFSYILSKSESSFSPSLLKWSTLYSLICSQPFFRLRTEQKDLPPSSTTACSSTIWGYRNEWFFSQAAHSLKSTLFGEGEKGKLKVQLQGSSRHSRALGRERRERN